MTKVKPLVKTKKKYKSILAFDMGVRNCAYSATLNNKLVDLGFVENTITELKDPFFNIQLKKFIKEFKELLAKFKPKAVCCERFQVRARFMGNSAELINVMIGIMSNICYSKGIYMFLMTAAQWKAAFNKSENVYDKLYSIQDIEPTVSVRKVKKKKVTTKVRKPTILDKLYLAFDPFPPHPIDALLQNLYFANLWNLDPYDKWNYKPLLKLSRKWLTENYNGKKKQRIK